MRVGLFVILVPGPNGKNAARENADDSNAKWKGMGWEMAYILEAGTYNFVMMSCPPECLAAIEDWKHRQPNLSTRPSFPRTIEEGIGRAGRVRG